MYTEKFNSAQIKDKKALVDTEFTGYLIYLYTKSPIKSSKADGRLIELFNTIIEDMKESLRFFSESRCRKGAETTDVSFQPQVMRFYIDREFEIKNYPRALIQFIEYCCSLHKDDKLSGYLSTQYKNSVIEELDIEIIRDCIQANFKKLRKLCEDYRRNGYQYSADDSLKELLLLQRKDGKVKTFFEKYFKEYITAAAEKYKSFYDVLRELAEQNGGSGSDNFLKRLYEEAGLNYRVYNNHKQMIKNPEREDVFALILKLKLNLKDAEALLKAAGFQLNDSINDMLLQTMINTKQWNLELYRSLLNRNGYAEFFYQAYVRAHYKKPPAQVFLEALYQLIRKRNIELDETAEGLLSKKDKQIKLKRLYLGVFGAAEGLGVFQRHSENYCTDAKKKKREVSAIAEYLHLKPYQIDRLMKKCPGIEHLICCPADDNYIEKVK